MSKGLAGVLLAAVALSVSAADAEFDARAGHAGMVGSGADTPVAQACPVPHAHGAAANGLVSGGELYPPAAVHAPVHAAVGGSSMAEVSEPPSTAMFGGDPKQRPQALPEPLVEDDPLDLMDGEFDALLLESELVVRDPWERFNRRMHRFNDVVDERVLRPVAVGYDKVLPAPVKSGVSRFFANLGMPVTAVNQLLQGRPRRAASSLGRFVVNTTIGIAGLMDPASHLGMSARDDADFGQTLAVWGWQDSRYLVLPLLGPRTVRDAVGLVGDERLSPIRRIGDSATAYTVQVLQVVDGRRRLLPLDDARHDAYDEYLLVRDAWWQRRAFQISKDPGQ